eukprot:337598-Lingulodinium_polyedra.AAC.1
MASPWPVHGQFMSSFRKQVVASSWPVHGQFMSIFTSKLWPVRGQLMASSWPVHEQLHKQFSWPAHG